MSFTDEDLAHLKASIPNIPDPEGQKKKLLAFIDRLEAAEKAVKFMWISEHPIDDSAKEAYKAWLQSAGRSGGEL